MACHFRREETIMEEKQTVKYILLTIENRTVRVAIGIQNNHMPIVYWMERGDLYSYVLFQGCMSEEEGRQILVAAEANNYAAACRLFHKHFRGKQSEKIYVEAEGRCPISEEVPDDWFDECKQILSLMMTNLRTVLVFERKEDW